MPEISYFFLLTIGGIVLLFLILEVTKFFDKPVANEGIIYQYPDQLSGLKENFIRCFKKKEHKSFLILDFENYYLQYLLFTEPGEIWCEAISNEFLKALALLSSTQIERLLARAY